MLILTDSELSLIDKYVHVEGKPGHGEHAQASGLKDKVTRAIQGKLSGPHSLAKTEAAIVERMASLVERNGRATEFDKAVASSLAVRCRSLIDGMDVPDADDPAEVIALNAERAAEAVEADSDDPGDQGIPPVAEASADVAADGVEAELEAEYTPAEEAEPKPLVG